FTLAVDDGARARLAVGTDAALVDAQGRTWGVIRVQDIFTRDPLEESRAVYGTEDPTHHGVAYLLARPRTLVGGSVRLLPLPASARFQAYEALVAGYYPKDRTILAAFPAAMRYAGPREALFHALARKNYGITHLLVGRDHAGVGKFYGPYDAHAIFERFTAEDLGVSPIKLDAAFFCRACGSLASTR